MSHQQNDEVPGKRESKYYLIDKKWWQEWTTYSDLNIALTNEHSDDKQQENTQNYGSVIVKNQDKNTNFNESRLNCLPSVEFTDESNRTSKIIPFQAGGYLP